MSTFFFPLKNRKSSEFQKQVKVIETQVTFLSNRMTSYHLFAIPFYNKEIDPEFSWEFETYSKQVTQIPYRLR